MQTTLFKMGDGRNIEFCTYGDPEGIPTFLFHGFLGSQRQASLMDNVFRTHGIRVIAPNRTGVGRTDKRIMSSIQDYADEMRQLADHLHIHEFGVVGISGGASFALACAYAMPSRVRLVLAVGLLPDLSSHEVMHRIYWLRRLCVWCAWYAPHVINAMLGVVQWYARRYPQMMLQLLERFLKPWNLDRTSQQSIDLYADMHKEIARDIFLQGDPSLHIVQELRIYAGWGFSIENVIPTVLLWHGTKDEVIPITLIQSEYADRKNIYSFKTYDGGHLDLLSSAENMICHYRETWTQLQN